MMLVRCLPQLRDAMLRALSGLMLSCNSTTFELILTFTRQKRPSRGEIFSLFSPLVIRTLLAHVNMVPSPTVALQIANQYKDYPVVKKRKAFEDIKEQVCTQQSCLFRCSL
jgi:hypothetical protein